MSAMKQVSSELMSRLHYVCGRVKFDDEDYSFIIEASDSGEAQDAFEKKLRDEEDDDDAEIIIIENCLLSTMLDQRLVAASILS